MFTPGRELSGAFYRDVVRPQIDRPHAAALLGWGSDVLGFDTERSTDHGWGPRLLIFLEGDLRLELPDEYAGWPVRYGWDGVPEQHHVTVTDLAGWLVGHLGFDATRAVSLEDWLVTPQQKLLEVVGGEVYADELGELTRVRERLAWYPDEVWRWMLACQWRRLAQEEAFVQRTAEVGDDLGSSLVAARLVRDLMHLALLQARRYAPYGKWLGSAFAQLDNADGLDLRGDLGAAFETIARRHNALGITDPVDPTLRRFHARPAQVLDADRFTEACLATVTDRMLRELPLIGAVDQWVDSADVVADPRVYRRLAVITHPDRGSI